jgi:hypothetical protein
MFLAFLALLLSPVYSSVKSCGKASDLFIINSLSQSPADSIHGGDNFTLTLLYTNNKVVNAGTATTSVTYNFIPLTPTVKPLCESFVCPLQTGQHDGSVSSLFPSGLSGTVVTKIVWKDDAGNQLLCISSTLSVS